mgnify:CR=1 FL=1
MKKAVLIIALLVGFVGYQQTAPAEPQVVASSSELDQVSKAFSEIQSKEDKVLIYKLFSGSAEYLNCKSLQATQQFDPILGRVQSSYGWNREKYPAFTDSVSAYLVAAGYNVPKPLTTDQERLDFAGIFEGLAEATKYE